MRKITLILNDLPKREKGMSLTEFQNIFGGCLANYVFCEKDTDCCSERCAYIIQICRPKG